MFFNENHLQMLYWQCVSLMSKVTIMFWKMKYTKAQPYIKQVNPSTYNNTVTKSKTVHIGGGSGLWPERGNFTHVAFKSLA